MGDNGLLSVIEVSAPAKIILLGEHSVVYGHKAVTCSLDLRCKVKLGLLQDDNNFLYAFYFEDISPGAVYINKEEFVKLKSVFDLISTDSATDEFHMLTEWMKNTFSGSVNLKSNTPLCNSLMSAIYLILKIVKKNIPLRISVHSELPIGAGLGSSASFSVALATALLVSNTKIPAKTNAWSEEDKNLINHYAFQCEILMHGKPSGIDNTISTFGKALLFQKGYPNTFLPNFPRVKIALINTKVPRSTKEVIADLRSRYQRNPEWHDSIFRRIENLVEQSLKNLNSGILSEFEDSLSTLIIANQKLLIDLGVSHSKIEEICSVFRHHDIPCKLTGAGVGGCVFALIPLGSGSKLLKGLEEQLVNLGFEFYLTNLCGDGVRIDKCMF